MIIPNNTQILTDEGKLAIATKEQEGTIVATGGASDITCLVDDGSGNKDLAVKVFAVEGDSVADSNISAQVLTSENELAIATTSQDGNVLTGHSATDKTCLVETETGKQIALKTFTLDGTLLASDGSSNTTCIVQDGNGNKQLALKVFGSSADWKGKPADWSDIRKDCPANSIALYAGHSIYTKVGNPTIVNGVVSGFSNDSYLRLTFNPSQPFEMVSKFKVSSLGERNVFWGVNTSGVLRFLVFTDGKLEFDFGTSTSAFDIGAIMSDFSISTNTYYWAKVIFTGSQYIASYSTDGTNYTQIGVINSTSLINNGSNITLQIGKGPASNTVFNGSIDLNETYIEVNGEYLTDQYDNLGFTATCSGGYKVFIDGTQYGSTYASGATCSITWSTSGIATGDIITTPSLLKAHKIWIEPAVAGNNITDFTGARVASVSGYEDEGILWAHFNIDTSIQFSFGASNNYRNRLIETITAKNNKINVSSLNNAFHYCQNLIYTPLFVGPQTAIDCYNSFSYCTKLQKLNFKNIKPSTVANMFQSCTNLLELPKIDFSSTTAANGFVSYTTNLKDTIIDISAATGLRNFGAYGNQSNPNTAIKGLIVSNQAPFTFGAPQISIQYTDLDRTALVNLFNDLPTVSAGQIISIVGCTGSEDLKAGDKFIATSKGWTITGGPAQETFYAYRNYQDGTIYADDNPVNKGTFTLTNATNNGFTDEGGGLFSGVNGGYIELDGTPDWQSLDTWAYIIKVKFNSFKTACLLGSADNKTPLLTFLNDGHLRFFANSPSFYDSSLQYGLNEWLYVKPYFTGTAYKVDISSSGRFEGEEVNYITVNSSAKNSATAKVWFGNVSSDTAQYIDGTIDMSECKKIENGVETSFGSFSGSKSIIYDSTLNEIAPQPSYSYQAPALNATVIGALTDNNGIISGFSASNTIATNIIPDNLTSYDCILHIKTPQTLLTTADTALFGHYNSGADLGYSRTTNKLFISNGFSSIDGTTVVQADTKYFIRLKLDSNTVSLYTLLDNNDYTIDTLPDLSNWTLECSGTTEYNIISNTLQICGSSYYGQYFNGSLDAVNSRFTLNGNNYNLYSLAKITMNNTDYIRRNADDITI